jgi:hypothetical protein
MTDRRVPGSLVIKFYAPRHKMLDNDDAVRYIMDV